MINQVQLHPQNPQEEMIAYCKQNHILTEAWSPLIQGQAFKRELLIETAEKYGVSVAQLCIRWIFQKALCPCRSPQHPSESKITRIFSDFPFPTRIWKKSRLCVPTAQLAIRRMSHARTRLWDFKKMNSKCTRMSEILCFACIFCAEIAFFRRI